MRVQQMLGFTLSPNIEREIRDNCGHRLDLEQPFSRTDLDQIGERVKHMNIISQVEGYLLIVKAFQVRSDDPMSARSFFQMAIGKFEEVLNSSANSKVALRNCARALAALEEEDCHLRNMKKATDSPLYIRANAYFQRAIEVDPTDPVTFFHCATFYEQFEQFDAAEDCYLRVLEMDPNFVEALHSYGSMLQERGDFEIAEQFLMRILSCDQALPLSKRL